MVKRSLSALAVSLSLTALQAAALEPPKWNLESLSMPPAAVEASDGKVAGVHSLYLDELPYKGRPAKFYAYFGLPTNVTGKVPAVVLVHGGGGSAFADWVKYWNAKGYAPRLESGGARPPRPDLPYEGPCSNNQHRGRVPQGCGKGALPVE